LRISAGRRSVYNAHRWNVDLSAYLRAAVIVEESGHLPALAKAHPDHVVSLKSKPK
jgi:maleylacetoacetate isomerase